MASNSNSEKFLMDDVSPAETRARNSPEPTSSSQPPSEEEAQDKKKSKKKSKKKIKNAADKTRKSITKFSKNVGNSGASLAKDFKAFISRGNVIDLAVGLVMGTAFTAIVNSLVADIIMPVITLSTKDANLESLFVVLRPGKSGNWTYSNITVAVGDGAVIETYGKFFQTILNFVIVSICMFFIVRAVAIMRREDEVMPNETTCVYCKSSISNEASRCKFCTSAVVPVAMVVQAETETETEVESDMDELKEVLTTKAID